MCRRFRPASGVSLSTPRPRVRGGPSASPFDVVETLLEREPFRHLPHDLPRADETPVAITRTTNATLGRCPALPGTRDSSPEHMPLHLASRGLVRRPPSSRRSSRWARDPP